MIKDFTFCVCTYNSQKTIYSCLSSIRRSYPAAEILVVDHFSNDDTTGIARSFGCRIESEGIGLGFARQRCLDLSNTEYIVFIDSDVEILDSAFLNRAEKAFQSKQNGAVVGLALGHRFSYGLPASLLVIRKSDFEGRLIPNYIDARETYFLQRRLDELQLKTQYVYNAMRHNSQYREYKPEWEGANTRLLPTGAVGELLFASKVMVLLTLNSRSMKNVLYLPIFFLKFFRGFANPGPWIRLKR